VNKHLLQEKLREIDEMKTTNQKQGYLKAQMDFLSKEKTKIDRRLDHIVHYKANNKDYRKFKLEKEQQENIESVNYQHKQNQKVNRLVGYKDSERDILSEMFEEEYCNLFYLIKRNVSITVQSNSLNNSLKNNSDLNALQEKLLKAKQQRLIELNLKQQLIKQNFGYF
jgi:hypothetical protein